MIGRMKMIRTLLVASAVIALLVFPAHCQGLGKNGGAYRGPPVEEHPKIDEKAYKSALERIPAPKQAYDPWGVARSSGPASGPAKTTKTPNQE
jgi:hypothetical protein